VELESERSGIGQEIAVGIEQQVAVEGGDKFRIASGGFDVEEKRT
jgi:hypothetical protein